MLTRQATLTQVLGCLLVVSAPLMSQTPPVQLETEQDVACYRATVTAYGTAAHGARIQLHSAPHELIRALQRALVWADAMERASTAVMLEIRSLQGSETLNSTPSTATAELWLTSPQPSAADGSTWDIEETLTGVLGNKVDIDLLTVSCEANTK